MITYSTFYILFSNKIINGKSSIYEDFYNSSFQFSVDFIQLIDDAEKQLEDFVKSITDDELALFYNVDDIPINTYNLRSKDDINGLFTDVKKNNEEECTHTFSLNIHKKSNKYISIYSFDNFVDYLLKLNVNEILLEFDSVFKKNKVRFWLIEDDDFLQTNTFIMSKNKSELDNYYATDFNRQNIYTKSEDIASINGNTNFRLFPEDFYLIEVPKQIKLIGILNSLCVMECFMYFCNNTTICNDKLIYRIIGYRQIRGELKYGVSINKASLDVYYHTYCWIYEGSNVSDKCGLARNIFSLHFLDGNEYSIEKDLFSEIKSCNEIYLKENVEKYIEVKNNVVVLINDLNSKIVDTVSAFSNRIRNSLLAVISFYFSTVLLNTISEHGVNNIFTNDMTYLSYTFIIGATIYFFLNLYDYYKTYCRYKKYYFRQKHFYTDILDKKDIENIFDNDEPYNEDIAEIKSIGIRYSLFWIFIVTLLCIIIYCLSGISMKEMGTSVMKIIKHSFK